jgi:hypothetical protein
VLLTFLNSKGEYVMSKIIFIALIAMFTTNAKASLLVNCKTNEGSVTTELQLEGAVGYVIVRKGAKLAYSSYINMSTYSEKWKSITVDATESTAQELNGVKIYFDMNRNTTSAAIRPYGQTTNKLFPESEGITVVGMTCDQSYEDIKKEVSDN